jgi:hypothetical protein
VRLGKVGLIENLARGLVGRRGGFFIESIFLCSFYFSLVFGGKGVLEELFILNFSTQIDIITFFILKISLRFTRI